MFNKICMRKEQVNKKWDGLGGDWRDLEYCVTGLWVWVIDCNFLCSKCFFVSFVKNADS